MSLQPFTPDHVADALVDLVVADGRVRALWIEADSAAKLRRPYAALEVHVAVDEPEHAAFVAGLQVFLAPAFTTELRSVADTLCFAKEAHVRLARPDAPAEKLDLRVVVEQTSLLAKRPRAWVAALVDKTTQLTHVMSFSAPRV